MTTIMNANPFEIEDLREKILEARREQMKKDYIRKIYPEWKKDELSGELYSDSRKITSTQNRLSTQWTLLPDSSKSVDTTPLLITIFPRNLNDIVPGYFDDEYVEPYHVLMDASHLMLREVERLWKHDPYYAEDDNYYNNIAIDFIHDCSVIHNRLSQREIDRRNTVLNGISLEE